MATELRRQTSLVEHRVTRPVQRSARIGLLGCGTVGSQVAKELLRADNPRKRLERIAVAHLDKQRPVPIPADRLISDALSIVKDPEIDIVIELIGGLELPAALIRQALVEGKSVVTANKEVVALHGAELSALAYEHGVAFFFEGAVGGAVPMVSAVTESLAGDRIRGFAGVLNGTTNYILSSVAAGELSVADAIRQAQDKGFAESDPKDDLSGADAARKAAILASLAFGVKVHPADVFTRGIEDLSSDDVWAARRLGFDTKLLVTAEVYSGFLQVGVEPRAVPLSHPLAQVDGSTNTLVITSDLAGRLVFTGPGAGGRETASAVLGDLRRAVLGHPSPRYQTSLDAPRVSSRKDDPARFVVRCISTTPDPLGHIEGALFSHGIGVEHRETQDHGLPETVIVTGIGERRCISKALATLDASGVQCVSLLKVLDESSR